MVKWRLRDIIDLEYFLHRDGVSGAVQEDLHERDRTIYLEEVLPRQKDGEAFDRKSALRAWLERRREAERTTSSVLPGEGTESLYGSLRFLFLGAGFGLGAATAGAFLSYTGESPVNVFAYLSLFVASQLLLLLLLGVFSLYRWRKNSFVASSPLYTLISRLVLRVVLSARKRFEKSLPAGDRLQAEATLGTMLGKSRSYGILFFLLVFILTQLFGLGFNLGLLGATLFKVVTSDIAFGWQSTIQLSPEAVHSLVEKIALPWSWAVPAEAAFPGLSQIEGSRIILKDGIYNLSTPNLVSWWPFLCFSVLVYGLMPRLLLSVWAVFAKRRYLGSLDLRQGACEQLLLRMTTPRVTSRGSEVAETAVPVEEETEPAPSVCERPGIEPAATRKLLVLIPDEIYDSCTREEIEAMANRGPLQAMAGIIRINQDPETDREMLGELAGREEKEQTDILVIQEAWQPPIMEYLDFLKELRRAVGKESAIRIGLIGKPGSATIFTPVKEENRQIWVRKISALGDPCTTSEELVKHAA